jgi:hypothetical protein
MPPHHATNGIKALANGANHMMLKKKKKIVTGMQMAKITRSIFAFSPRERKGVGNKV